MCASGRRTGQAVGSWNGRPSSISGVAGFLPLSQLFLVCYPAPERWMSGWMKRFSRTPVCCLVFPPGDLGRQDPGCIPNRGGIIRVSELKSRRQWWSLGRLGWSLGCNSGIRGRRWCWNIISYDVVTRIVSVSSRDLS